MDTFSLIFIIALFTEVKSNVENEEPILYYYGLVSIMICLRLLISCVHNVKVSK